jgi:hypothetical protein
MHGSRTAILAVAVVFAAFAACSDDVTDPNNINEFTATLFTVGGTSNTGGGDAQLTNSGGTLTYSVDFQGLATAPVRAVIKRGGAGAQTGADVVFLCGTGAAQACPGGTMAGQDDPNGPAGTLWGSITGTADAAPILNDMRGFNAFIQIETAQGPALRGNIVGSD